MARLLCVFVCVRVFVGGEGGDDRGEDGGGSSQPAQLSKSRETLKECVVENHTVAVKWLLEIYRQFTKPVRGAQKKCIAFEFQHSSEWLSCSSAEVSRPFCHPPAFSSGHGSEAPCSTHPIPIQPLVIP